MKEGVSKLYDLINHYKRVLDIETKYREILVKSLKERINSLEEENELLRSKLSKLYDRGF